MAQVIILGTPAVVMTMIADPRLHGEEWFPYFGYTGAETRSALAHRHRLGLALGRRIDSAESALGHAARAALVHHYLGGAELCWRGQGRTVRGCRVTQAARGGTQ